MYLLTTLFAVSLGLGLGTLIRPGVGVNYNPDAVVKAETNAEDKPASGSGVETNEDKKGEETAKPVNPDVEAIRKKLGTAKEAGTLNRTVTEYHPAKPNCGDGRRRCITDHFFLVGYWNRHFVHRVGRGPRQTFL